MNCQYQASLSELHAMLEAIESFAMLAGFSGQDLGKIILVSEEVLVNIISYAYPEGGGSVSVMCNNHKNFIEIIIKDQGVAYNPLTHEPKVLNKADKKGGFGIILVLQMMDQVDYSRVDNCNILKLIKLK